LAVTRISSIGGFLRTGNVTLLIGLQAGDVELALGLLKTPCRKRMGFVNVAAAGIAPMEAEVGGATIFILPVARYIHLGISSAIVDSRREPGEAGGLKLILAIVSQEQSGKRLNTLTGWSYRATLISTTGGFLRRGNATLFIGARSERVDSMLDQIRRICQATDAADSTATIFVLDIVQRERIESRLRPQICGANRAFAPAHYPFGNVHVNRVPLPGSLSAQICP
jgi:uncharacterized protein YaaQ